MENKTRSYLNADDLEQWERALEEQEKTVCSVVVNDKEYKLKKGESIKVKLVSKLDFINSELFPVLRDMSHATHWLWWELIKLRDPQTNIAFYKPKDKVAVNRLAKSYKELDSLSLVRRIKRQHYLINPEFYYSGSCTPKNIQEVWESIE